MENPLMDGKGRSVQWILQAAKEHPWLCSMNGFNTHGKPGSKRNYNLNIYVQHRYLWLVYFLLFVTWFNMNEY